MMLPLLAFVLISGTIFGGYMAVTYLPGLLASRRLERRLRDVSGFDAPDGEPGTTVVRQQEDGPLPGLDRFVSRTRAGSWLGLLIDRSGVKTTPGAVVGVALAIGTSAALVAILFSGMVWAAALAGLAGALMPVAFLVNRRSARQRRFEEQFPEALDLLSRAIRAGHAFQTALGMVAEEVTAPVGPEFKKTFEQQNFGLPLREALNGLSDRMPLLDVRFFVTAVTIQRESGGNLSEILENLAHVVRERFKIRRQVRTHTAHGRFTGWVLLALPAFLAVALSRIAPDQMELLFKEPMGRMMLACAVVLQTVGYFWIRRVIKIEV